MIINRTVALVMILLPLSMHLSAFNLSLLLDPFFISPIMQRNRDALALVPHWVTPEDYKNSFFGFGLPERVKHLIDLPIGNEATYSDILVALMRCLKKDISYLEIGVSVGKNFFQMLHATNNATLYGFDIENINPTLAAMLDTPQVCDTWPTPTDSVKKNNSTITAYRSVKTNNKVMYLSGDIFDEQSWKRLAGKKFNIIFSDACHTPEGLLKEYEMIKKYALLDNDQFVMVWDDLGGIMTDAWRTIFKDIQQQHNLPDNAATLAQLRGWLGVHEYLHIIGIIIKT